MVRDSEERRGTSLFGKEMGREQVEEGGEGFG